MSGSRTSRAALVVGANRGIGLHFTKALLSDPQYETVFSACRNPGSAKDLTELQKTNRSLHIVRLDVLDDSSVKAAAACVEATTGRLDLLIYSAGLLHDGAVVQPEKRLADVNPEGMLRAFQTNAIGALLVAREFERVLRSGTDPVMAALSARVSSIGDNRKGGWYAYRSSKAALNMMIKSLAIEWARLPRPITCYLLHPGTVATQLSAPFRGNVPDEKVFTAPRAARLLLETIDELGSDHSGGFFAYDGSAIEW